MQAVLGADSEPERFFDLALDLLVIAGVDNFYKRVNPAFEQALGYPREELLSRPYVDFIHPDDVKRSTEAVADVKRGADVIGFENRFICADGSVCWIQWNTRAVVEHGLVYCVGRDVTDRRLADAQLREAQRLLELSHHELEASRRRIIAATDAARRQLVRDLHDGAQQRLVHTVILLKLALETAADGREGVPGLLAEGLENAQQAMTELRELAHGILPAALSQGGLSSGVEVLAGRISIPVSVDLPQGRLSTAVEATAYFAIAEALTNVAKHSGARRAAVAGRIEHGTLVIEIRDDGQGGARPDGTGLQGLADRLAAAGGQFSVDSPAAGGTLITAVIPVGD